MNTTVLSIIKNNSIAQVELRNDNIIVLGSAKTILPEVTEIVNHLHEHGVYERVEKIEGNKIFVGAKRVASDNSHYAEYVADSFRSHGFGVVIHTEEHATLWRLLHLVPLETDVQVRLLRLLDHMSPEDMHELTAEFQDAYDKIVVLQKKKHESGRKILLAKAKMLAVVEAAI